MAMTRTKKGEGSSSTIKKSSSKQETGTSDVPVDKCSQQQSESSGSNLQTPNYICSICRNDERLRGKSIDAIMEDLLSKVDTAII